MAFTRLGLVAAVYLIWIRDGKVLLIRRANTGHEDGNYGLPAGHLEGGETLKEGIIREAREEIAVILEPENLTMVHTMHRKKTDHERIDFFFTANEVLGEPKNAEPDKCDDVAWFPIDNLPANTIVYVRQAIDAVRRGQTFSEFGWS